jgi:hypothetical protein
LGQRDVATDRWTGGRTVKEGERDRDRERETERQRQTDMPKLIVAFRNFPNAPKNGITLINQLVEQQDL